jgi:penicillin-binding protein 2
MNDFRIRARIFTGVIIVVLGILGFRLVQMQLLRGEKYSGTARASAVRERVVTPARGTIYDRNDRVIVNNEPTYTLTLTPRYFRPEAGLPEPERQAELDRRVDLLAELMNVTDSTVIAKLEEASRWSTFRPTPAFREVPQEAYARVQENLYRLPGVNFEFDQTRQYPSDAKAAHALGYVREVTRAELDYLAEEGYRPGDKVGKTGLEKNYESELRGRQGSEFNLVNIHGQTVRPYEGGAEDAPPKVGYELHTTLDAGVQALAETLMTDKRGGIVALDPDNGEIISIVSKPDYNPEIFSRSIPTEKYQYLTQSPQKPMYNRATMMAMPPGSTIKPGMALMGLNEGLISADSKLNCPGTFYLGSQGYDNFGQANLGMITVKKAIERSCNTFFFNLYMKANLDMWSEYMHMYGFGERVPMDIGEQATGIVADSAYMNRNYPGGWTRGYTVNLGIGQGNFTVTPMQHARYVAMIANKGTLYAPHLVKKIVDPNTGEDMRLMTPAPEEVPIDEKHFETVHEGMRRVVQHGTAARVQVPGIAAGAKTGTAQNPHGKDHSVFIMFAPVDDPEIAVASMIENAGFGGETSGPIVSLMIEKYLTGEITRGSEGQNRYTRAMSKRSQPISATN